MRAVLEIARTSDPGYSNLVVTCGDTGSPCIGHDLLETPEIVLEGDKSIRYRLGPVIVDGNGVLRAAAIVQGAGQVNLSTEWVVSYEMTPDAAKRFAAATTFAVGQVKPMDEIAIVVAGLVVSAPRVINPITNGSGEISGLSKSEAKKLARQLNGLAP